MPTTSIYSRSDGVVAWQACLNGDDIAHASDIEVDGSHIGLAWNPKVLAIIADRLGQPHAGAASKAPSRPRRPHARSRREHRSR